MEGLPVGVLSHLEQRTYIVLYFSKAISPLKAIDEFLL